MVTYTKPQQRMLREGSFVNCQVKFSPLEYQERKQNSRRPSVRCGGGADKREIGVDFFNGLC